MMDSKYSINGIINKNLIILLVVLVVALYQFHLLSLVRDNGYLISASSAAIEFPFNEMIQYALLNDKNNIMQISLSDIQLNQLDNQNIHRNINFKIQNNINLTIVNGGMPITFLGILNPTIPEKFDLTVSCMVAASIQAVYTKHQTNDEQTIIPLHSEYSKIICEWFDQ